MTIKEIAERDSINFIKKVPGLLAAQRQWWIDQVKNKTPFPMYNEISDGPTGNVGCCGAPPGVPGPSQHPIVPDFVQAFRSVAAEAHDTARSKGFWADPISFGEKIALIHSELSEAIEGYRHSDPPDDKIPEFTSVEAELADAVIRIMDLSYGKGYRVAEAVVAKMKYNEGRPHKHGKTC